ncbi:MAG: pimeloyl-ACP methyl ester carboxylesterase [Verrucomicrobiales bacterium]
MTLRLPSRLIRTCPQPRSYSATGGAQARAELPKKWKVFYTVGGEPSPTDPTQTAISSAEPSNRVYHRTVEIDGQSVFYREAGPKDAPTLLLLHGFPTSSHMFRNLIPALADTYHVVAPDYPGYGQSSMPPVDEFEYTFDHMAEIVEEFTEKVGLDRFSLYLMDYGAPVGFRLATKNPDRIDSLIIQNGNAYDEGLREFWKPLKAYWNEQSTENADALRGFLTLEATKWQYTAGTRDPETISPDNWTIDQALLDRPGNQEIQLAMFLDYGSNPRLYPKWQEYLRTHQPPTLIVWGKNDPIFPAEGAHPYKHDLTNLEFHLLDTGHFALEEAGEFITKTIREFLRGLSLETLNNRLRVGAIRH